MPTWRDIQDFARTKYNLVHDEPEKFSITFALDSGRSQMIWVTRFEAFDREWIEFRTPVCKEDEMAPKVALRKNSELSVGTLCLGGDHYFMIWNMAIKNMRLEDFELPLHVITIGADQLEQTYSAGNDDY